jgi:hypothetical protein
MAKITKMLTYSVPDEMYSTATTLGKTSTQLYNGPAELILWISKDTGRVTQSWEAENEPAQPLPLDLKREILKADTDENCIRIGLIHSGFDKPKIYEVAVGPADAANATVVDPSDVRIVYNRETVDSDYTAPLSFFEYLRDRSIEFTKIERNSLLAASDSRLASDMPAALKEQWMTYRQKLRDLPADWAGVPGYLIRFPMSPDDSVDMEFNDPYVDVIRIADRTDIDNDALSQLPAGVK